MSLDVHDPENLPLSQDQDVYEDTRVFLSTQIQSRIDELDEELAQRQMHSLLHRFAHTPPVRPVKRARSEPVVAKKVVKRKKTTRKKLSATEEMIHKLSGRPGKVRQMKLNGQSIVHVDSPLMPETDRVFSQDEWDRMRDLLRRSIQVKTPATRVESVRDDDDNDDEWWMGNQGPSGLMEDEFEGLGKTREVVEDEVEPPITLSQALVGVYEHTREEEVVDLCYSEVEDSEDDGMPIIFPMRSGGVSQGRASTVEPRDVPEKVVTKVLFKGPVELRSDVDPRCVEVQAVEEGDVVYDSVDEEETNLFLIKR